MTTPLRRLTGGKKRDGAFPTIALEDWIGMFQFNGVGYPMGAQSLVNGREEVPGNFSGLVEMAFRGNGAVFACMLIRQLVFQEARFQFRRMKDGRPGDYFGTTNLSLLENPWPGATTGDLLARAMQDIDLAGNFYVYRRDASTLVRLRPDWVSIILGSTNPRQKPDEYVVQGDIDAEVVGYAYKPGGPGSGRDLVVLLPEQVAHFAPIPDPCASYRGMSWVMPVIRDIMADGAMTTHKLSFLENGATPNTVVTLDASIKQDAFDKWVDLFEADHKGAANAYKTLYLGAGANIEVIGTDLKSLDFRATQGMGELRIAAAAGVPPMLVGFAEGLQASTLANYAQARRQFADATMRPLWRNLAGSLQKLVTVPNGAVLWYDDRDISFLQEDQKDAADIMSVQAVAARQLVDAGFDADSVVLAISANDLNLLKHSGLFSVQLQPAGKVSEGAGALVQGVPVPTADPAAAATNGSGS